MIKKIEVMNIELDNYSTREAMLLVETFLNNTVLNVIEEVSMRLLVDAKEDGELQESIRSFDLAIPGDREILVEAGYDNSPQINDVDNDNFFHEFAKRVIRNKKSVFLLGQTEEDVEKLQEYLKGDYERMNIIGMSYLDKYQDDLGIINEINIAAPDVILSVIPSPGQERFIAEQKQRLHAKLWYGMNAKYLTRKSGNKVALFAKTLVGRMLFKRGLSDYNNTEEE
ncbi:MAG: WecB/TagA/CpsF family glycosyltransferase [Lachnospiraceae bacterium]|nr:WecB/TagA/CpsF family glycosyltransferase [Lachnospiraceae bacterium]